MSIPFTQYLRPDGRQRPCSIERPGVIEEMAKAVIAAGYAFTVEELSTGEVSLEACRDSDESVLASEICDNGPPILAAVDKLMRDAYEAVQKEKSERESETSAA